MDITKIDLDAPAFGKEEKNPEEVTDVKLQEEPKKEPTSPKEPEIKENKEPKEEEVPEEKPRKPSVTYSRFKNVHERAIEAEREARELKARLEELESKPKERSVYREAPGELPEYWKELYGDSDASKKAFLVQNQRESELKEELREEALNAFRNQQKQEAHRLQENSQKIEENMEDLSAFVGRDLTDEEQSKVLDIVDEYTPKDEEGNYLGATIPFEKAWEIYELKNEVIKSPLKKSRDNVASITGSHSEGEPEVKIEKDKNFNPLDWNAYQKRI